MTRQGRPGWSFVRRLACVLLLLLVGCGESQVPLYRSLSEREANRLVAYLAGHNIAVRKSIQRDGVQVSVAADQMAEASRLAVAGGLPRDEYKGFGAVFQKDGLISSPLEERARLTFATAQQIESMLMEIDGVVSARVNIVIPERRNGKPTEPAAAAVLVRHLPGLETDVMEMKVRRLVAASVPGLVDGDARQISVGFLSVGGEPLADEPAASVPAALPSPQPAEPDPARTVAAGLMDRMAWIVPLVIAAVGLALWQFSDRLSAWWMRRRKAAAVAVPSPAATGPSDR